MRHLIIKNHKPISHNKESIFVIIAGALTLFTTFSRLNIGLSDYDLLLAIGLLIGLIFIVKIHVFLKVKEYVRDQEFKTVRIKTFLFSERNVFFRISTNMLAFFMLVNVDNRGPFSFLIIAFLGLGILQVFYYKVVGYKFYYRKDQIIFENFIFNRIETQLKDVKSVNIEIIEGSKKYVFSSTKKLFEELKSVYQNGRSTQEFNHL